MSSSFMIRYVDVGPNDGFSMCVVILSEKQSERKNNKRESETANIFKHRLNIFTLLPLYSL